MTFYIEKNEEVICAICLCEINHENKGMLDCVHRFCFGCIRSWRGRKEVQLCPICKHPFSNILQLDVNNNRVSIDPPITRFNDGLVSYRVRNQPFYSESTLATEESIKNVLVLFIQCCGLGCFILFVAVIKRLLFRH